MASLVQDDNYNIPPDIPVFSGCVPKKPKKDSTISEALTNAAVAFANACSGQSRQDVCQGQHSDALSVSPSKSVEVLMKNFATCRIYMNDRKLNQSEYLERKESLPSSLRKIT